MTVPNLDAARLYVAAGLRGVGLLVGGGSGIESGLF